MKAEERIDRLEKRFYSLDKKVWILIVLFVALGYNQGNGALTGILTGAAVSEVEGHMDPAIWLGMIAIAGSGYRAWLGFKKAQEKNPLIDWDWSMFLISVVPSMITAFSAAAGLDMELTAPNGVMVFLGAAGLNSLQDKFGLQKKK